MGISLFDSNWSLIGVIENLFELLYDSVYVVLCCLTILCVIISWILFTADRVNVARVYWFILFFFFLWSSVILSVRRFGVFLFLVQFAFPLVFIYCCFLYYWRRD